MTPARLSVRHPIFILSIVALLLSLGAIALKRLPVDLFPDITFPTIIVVTSYPGAGPQEVETAISKIIEDQVSAIAGVKKVSSQNRDGQSLVMVEFDLKSNLDYAEQQVRAKVSNAARLLPDDVDQPLVQKISPSDQPILSIALEADLSDAEIFDLAKERITPRFEQVDKVGQVDIVGGRKREIFVELDRNRLHQADISATAVVNALKSGGRNIPTGKTDAGGQEYTYRTLAEFNSLSDLKETVLRSASISYPVTVGTLGEITDRLQDETTRTRLNGSKTLLINVFRQSGANSVYVAEQVKTLMAAINKELGNQGKKAKMTVVSDLSRRIRNNVNDVYESILFGIILTILVVYLFLGSLKSTLITGFALPNSLLGACIFMSFFGFSINIMSLLAMSLVVGLLVDDAIVVRENIFRKLEAGILPKKAAIEGTDQVTLAVIATTATILAVFGPIGNLEGIVGQFFKEFGLTVCFAMLVSLFDGLYVAPALSAYMGGGGGLSEQPSSRIGRWNKLALAAFDRFQSWLERKYVVVLGYSLRRPLLTLGYAVLVFFFSIFVAKFVPFTFMPPQDNGEFFVQFELPAGSSLDASDSASHQIEASLKELPQVRDILVTVGSSQGESNKGTFFLRLKEKKLRKQNTSEMKKVVQDHLKKFAGLKVIVTDQSGAGGQRPFNLNIVGQDLDVLVPYSEKVLATLEKNETLQQANSSYRAGKPEYQIVLNKEVAKMAGVAIAGLGQELRILVEGQKPAIFRQAGVEYDIRVRLREDQRDLRTQFNKMFVPNVNQRLVPLEKVAMLRETKGPTTVLRENRSRYIQLSADITPGKKGLGGAMKEISELMKGDLKPPPGVSFNFVGEAERFQELMTNMLVSLGLGMLFIYLVLASLYGSVITPFTIMLVIPLAACGAFLALFITRSSFDLFSMIGCVMLMGLATKNSILLVDYAVAETKKGTDRVTALLRAGETRLRPIIMTSLALIAGMIPVAIGLNEASKQRTSLGIVVIGGTISSTLLTLVVIPAAYIYVDRFQDWLIKKYQAYFGHDDTVV